ncbi:hypothetical protein [Neobacillus cucumis]|uniref:hypothetical protein n=1 Tax=Neobacillus cucumis TaxID=1740721 RepID=UPI0028535F65|nr:hypothetical protein [Neobacillus cucumis]MDR4950326.1 hypothetical protein [Neobacillus cucumis]
MKSKEEILKDLKKELLRIGSTNQRDYDLLKKKGHVISTTICRRLKLSWSGVVEQTGLKRANN